MNESTRGASEIRDADKIVYRESGCIGRMDETEDFSVELFAVDVGADRDE